MSVDGNKYMVSNKEKLNNILDYLFLSFLVFGSFLANKGAIPFAIFGLVPVIVRSRELWSRRSWSVPRNVAAIFFVYFFYGFMTLCFFTGLGPGDTRPVNPDFELYGVAVLLALLGLLRGALIAEPFAKLQFIQPWALLATFFVLSGYALLNVTGDGRVQAEAPWPFIPALVFATWTFLSLFGWGILTKRQRLFRLALLSLSILVVNGYTGSRGIGLAQFVVIIAFCLAAFVKRYRNRLPSARDLAIATLAGLCLLGVQQSVSGYGALLRLEYISQLTVKAFSSSANDASPAATTQASKETPLATPPSATAPAATLPATAGQTSPAVPPGGETSPPSPERETKQPHEPPPSLSQISPDASIAVRLSMWSVSIRSFLDAPILGHGSMSMKTIIQNHFGLQHNHNQYLTWMVTGGTVLLLLGLAFLSLPYFIAAGLEESDRLVIVLSLSLLWGVAMLFDSFFSLKFYLHYYCLLLGLLTGLVHMRRKEVTETELLPAKTSDGDLRSGAGTDALSPPASVKSRLFGAFAKPLLFGRLKSK